MSYGNELILDLVGCEVKKLKSTEVEKGLHELCGLVGMTEVGYHFTESELGDETEGNEKTNGISACLFLIESSISFHGLWLTRCAFLNLFSCGKFDPIKVVEFVESYWKCQVVQQQLIVRG